MKNGHGILAVIWIITIIVQLLWLNNLKYYPHGPIDIIIRLTVIVATLVIGATIVSTAKKD